MKKIVNQALTFSYTGQYLNQRFQQLSRLSGTPVRYLSFIVIDFALGYAASEFIKQEANAEKLASGALQGADAVIL